MHMNLHQSNLEVSNAGKLARENAWLVMSAGKCSAVSERRGAGERITSAKRGNIHVLALFLHLIG